MLAEEHQCYRAHPVELLKAASGLEADVAVDLVREDDFRESIAVQLLWGSRTGYSVADRQ